VGRPAFGADQLRQDGGAIPVEAIGGLLGFGGGWIGTMGVVIVECMVGHGDVCGGSVGLGAVLLVPLGTASGVYAGGALTGGSGRFLPTWLGAGIGLGAGVATYLGVASIEERLREPGQGGISEALFPVLMISLPVTGGIVGYELSEARNQGSATGYGTNPATLRLVPTLGREQVGACMVLTW
jgi:hypothetical protein